MGSGRGRVTSIAVAATVVAISGCSTSSSGGGRPTGPSGIRGTGLAAFSCSAKPDGKALRVTPSAIVELRVCALSAPEPFNRPAHTIPLTRGSPQFEALLTALSEPDAPTPSSPVACPEYAELLPSVIASTETGALLVHLPADACNHSLPAVRTALAAVTGAGGTM